jgi:ABC-type branched-subunit amino acid transport system ATPase component
VLGGIAFVPQGNRVFGELTAREYIEIGRYLIADKSEIAKPIEAILELFPTLNSLPSE